MMQSIIAVLILSIAMNLCGIGVKSEVKIPEYPAHPFIAEEIQ